MKFYQYPNCGTCRNAAKFLGQQGVDVKTIDISQQPPSKAELKRMLAAYDGERKKLFNTSGKLYRELAIKDKLPQMSDAEAIELLSGNGMLIKRPFLLASGNNGLVGFKAEQWQEFLREIQS